MKKSAVLMTLETNNITNLESVLIPVRRAEQVDVGEDGRGVVDARNVQLRQDAVCCSRRVRRGRGARLVGGGGRGGDCASGGGR